MNTKGFTLIELMVVIAIVGIIAGLSIPAFTSSIMQGRVKTVAYEVYQDVYLAKTEAIKRNTPAYVDFNMSSDNAVFGWGVNWLDTTGNKVQIKSFDLSPYSGYGITVQIAASSITFDPIRGLIDITQNINIISNYGCITVSLTPLGFADIGVLKSCV